jgi:hypothetical protein
MANMKESRMCQTCQGAGCDAYGYNCGDCGGHGAIIVDVAPKDEPAAEPEEYVRKVIVPQVDQYDFIAKRIKEIEEERLKAINTPDPDTTPTPAAISTQTDEDFYAWGY